MNVRCPSSVFALMLLSTGCAEKPPEPAPPITLVAHATAYCQSGTTKSGEQTRAGVIAADPAVLPLGTVVRIDAPEERHDGVYRVLDTGSAVRGKIVDIFMPNCRAATRFGRREVLIEVLNWGDRAEAGAVGTSGGRVSDPTK